MYKNISFILNQWKGYSLPFFLGHVSLEITSTVLLIKYEYKKTPKPFSIYLYMKFFQKKLLSSLKITLQVKLLEKRNFKKKNFN